MASAGAALAAPTGPLLPLGVSLLARTGLIAAGARPRTTPARAGDRHRPSRALRAPARQIADNAGEDGAWIVGKLLENEDYGWGFNAATGEYQDPGQGRRDRPRQGRAHCAAGCGVGRLAADHDRSACRRAAEEEKASAMSAMDF